MANFSRLFNLLILAQVAVGALIIIPKVPKLPKTQDVYQPPPPRPAGGNAPKPITVYKPPSSKDPCGIPYLSYLCTDSTEVAAATTTATGCATTDAACLNCGLAYQSQAAAANYDPLLFQRPFEYQAAALCYQVDLNYNTLVWAPGFFDGPYGYCYEFWSSMGESTSAYWASYFQGFCTKMGNVLGVRTWISAAPTIVAARATDTYIGTGTIDATDTTGVGALETSPATTARFSTTTRSSAADTNIGSGSGAVASRQVDVVISCFAAFAVTVLIAAVLL